ncbi:MAG: DUF1501 domain-containing protein [Acidobacteriia bacterium]|nr:DUF1501 domain-containing protein [Terriglobia bacterium]
MTAEEKRKCECQKYHGRNHFWDGPGLSRRQFFALSGTALAGYYFLPVLRPLETRAQSPSVSLLNTAKTCIYIHLDGAPSHADTFDLKEGSWTPSNFAPTSYGNIRWPQGLMPNLAKQMPHLTFVRSARAWALIHSLGQVWKQIARNPAAALGKISPNIGSVVAYEYDKHRTAGQLLPGFISLNSGSNLVGSGYFAAQYANFDVAPSQNGLANVTHPDGQARFNTRWSLLHTLDDSLRQNSPMGRRAEDMDQFYTDAQSLMYNSTINSIFSFTSTDHTAYGGSSFGDACIVARNIVKSNQGTHFITISLGGWDNHQNIYAANGIYGSMKQFDPGLAALISDLAGQPGSSGGKSLLDETLIVAAGEFGRTVGALNNQNGRDHYLQLSILFAGGGSKGNGQAIGSTDATGSATVDPGWSQGRDIKPEDIACTIYSALGIDYTSELQNDPLHRGFEYVPFAKFGVYYPVNEVFS